MNEVINPHTLDSIIKTITIGGISILIIVALVIIKIRLDKKSPQDKKVKPKK